MDERVITGPRQAEGLPELDAPERSDGDESKPADAPDDRSISAPQDPPEGTTLDSSSSRGLEPPAMLRQWPSVTSSVTFRLPEEAKPDDLSDSLSFPPLDPPEKDQDEQAKKLQLAPAISYRASSTMSTGETLSSEHRTAYDDFFDGKEELSQETSTLTLTTDPAMPGAYRVAGERGGLLDDNVTVTSTSSPQETNVPPPRQHESLVSAHLVGSMQVADIVSHESETGADDGSEPMAEESDGGEGAYKVLPRRWKQYALLAIALLAAVSLAVLIPLTLKDDDTFSPDAGDSEPRVSDSSDPSVIPSMVPSLRPLLQPSASPIQGTATPTVDITPAPSWLPTAIPSLLPSALLTQISTSQPVVEPTNRPTLPPTGEPTVNPTPAPTPVPTSAPTPAPTLPPTRSRPRTRLPTSNPQARPTGPEDECVQYSDGSIECIFEDWPRSGLITVIACFPAAALFSGCTCNIVEEDSAAQIDSSDEQCSLCSMCCDRISFDSSNFDPDEPCAVQTCEGECIGANSSPNPVPVPTPTPTPTPPSREVAKCFDLNDGSIACAIEDFPLGGLITIFFECPVTASTVLDCGICVTVEAESLEQLDESDPLCFSCSLCSESVAFDCSNLSPGIACDCSGTCS